MKKMFYPESLVIIGLSNKANNIPRLILENLLRWGYMGRIFGVNPRSDDDNVNGVKMFKKIDDLPIVPDLAVALIPAKFVPSIIEECGKFGIKRMSIPSGGFNELGDEGERLAELAIEMSNKYEVKFVGPNGVTIANTANGLCLPFVPSYIPNKGGMSIITQSGGVGLMLWNLMNDEDIGMAKFASIGNKLILDEVDFLKYFGEDPDTEFICLYLESIPRGKALIEAAEKIDKPIIILKSSTTEAGNKMAMSHTAAIRNNDEIIDSAFERAGIIRIRNFSEFISVVKAFKMPPMKGKRIMVMSPAGGFSVMMADQCERVGFEFADPGEEFYNKLNESSNAGVINFSNPLDMGDIYDPEMYGHIFYSVMHNENIDGAVYVSQWPQMPRGDDVFHKMFHTDLSNETIGAIQSSGKPLGVTLFGLAKTTTKIKQNISLPIFNNPEEMINALKIQRDYYKKRDQKKIEYIIPENVNLQKAKQWLDDHNGVCGEEALELLEYIGVITAQSSIAINEKDAVNLSSKIGYPVVMKIVSPDAIHKSEVGGVIVGIKNDDEAKEAFIKIKNNLFNYKKDADFQGVRVMEMAANGYDMFIGGTYDESFGSVVFFGYGGIYIEVFNDTENVLCPSCDEEIEEKISRLKSYKILKGTRGKQEGDINGYIDMINRVTHLMDNFPEIKELDLNPVRILEDGSGVVALDVRLRIEKE